MICYVLKIRNLTRENLVVYLGKHVFLMLKLAEIVIRPLTDYTYIIITFVKRRVATCEQDRNPH